MSSEYYARIAGELELAPQQVQSVALLLEDGATIPFIARYRKERTGSLDEVVLTDIRDRLAQLQALDSRRQAILKSLEERGLLTDDLRENIGSAVSITVLEDLYLPYRPKRRTRATMAKEKGLEPLAHILFEQKTQLEPQQEAVSFVNDEKGVQSAEDALAGARDIIAEWINDSITARTPLRALFEREGILQSKVVKGKERQAEKFSDYFQWEEQIKKMPGHRVLAMFRGENEGLLKLIIRPPEEKALAQIERKFIKNDSASAAQVMLALHDSYQRLLAPSIETDTRRVLKERADAEALRVFARNLKETLMAPPLGQKAILAIDPGYRTGCKIVCLDRQGMLLYNTIIYVEQSPARTESAAKTVIELIERFNIEAIAIGNGTASRETDTFIRSLDLPAKIPLVMVNESGASIYSASSAARDEFPDHDVTVRGAISIGRRLMDPLAELVKIDPRSIGVGQYQHDVDQLKLKTTLDDTVMLCVNEVGVEVNTASAQLLSYVSGLGPALAKNIIAYRNNNGPFRSRQELTKVTRLGSKVFEQAAGFLRIREAENPLDGSAVHPESYRIVQRMADDLGCTIEDLINNGSLLKQIQPERYTEETIGLPTVNDILAELHKPGRDPRKEFEAVAFDAAIYRIDQLVPGMTMTGIVTNVTNFGAFIDIGIHQDGLVHISQLSDKFVRNPADVVKLNQKVTVTVTAVDVARKRISLSMRQNPSLAS